MPDLNIAGRARPGLLLCIAAALLAGCRTVAGEWPAAPAPGPRDAALDERARAIVAGMTLEQKVGQMTQADIRSVTPDDVRRYYIGLVLDGGDAWPHNDKHAAVADWLAVADTWWDASMHTDMAVKVPVIW